MTDPYGGKCPQGEMKKRGSKKPPKCGFMQKRSKSPDFRTERIKKRGMESKGKGEKGGDGGFACAALLSL